LHLPGCPTRLAPPERIRHVAHGQDPPLSAAIEEAVRDGDKVAFEGFTHLIPYAAGHEAIRQRRKGLTLVRMTPDLLYDQMIRMGAARKVIFSWGGNPGVGSLHRFRAAYEQGWPQPLPHWTVTAIAVVPGGAHPSYAQGYYKRDNAFYEAWDEISRSRDSFKPWMEANVMQKGPEAFAGYAHR
jgi:hypothetical protein